jgi:hypothetical protein
MPLQASRVLKTLYAMYFDGVDDYVKVYDSDSLHIFGSMTVFLWVVPYFSSAYRVVTTKWDGDANHEIFVFGLTNYRMFYAIHRNILTYRYYVETSQAYTSGLWYPAAVVCDLASLSIIVNGGLKNSTSYSGTPYPNTGNLYIGQRGDNAYWFGGYLANLTIYSRSLSDSEILWNYNHPDDPVRNGLALWLQADPNYIKDIDGDGVLEWIDLSGYGNHGKIYGARLVQFIKSASRVIQAQRVLACAR